MHGIQEALSRGANRRRWPDVHGSRTVETSTPFFSLCESHHVAGALPRHRHPRPYACIVIAGAFDERSGGRVESATAGTVLLHPEGSEHDDRFGPSGAICVNVSPSPTWLDATRDAGDSLFRDYRAVRGEAALHLGRAIRRHLGAADTAERLSLEAATLALLSEAAAPPCSRSTHRRWIDRVCEEIRSDPCREWTLAGVAASAGVHPMHVARTFRYRVGMSLGQFVRGERLSWARGALSATDASIAAIATDAGFYDESHFIRVFRRHFGTTPGSCRAPRSP
jgi:AraC family transcriptional regulator